MQKKKRGKEGWSMSDIIAKMLNKMQTGAKANLQLRGQINIWGLAVGTKRSRPAAVGSQIYRWVGVIG